MIFLNHGSYGATPHVVLAEQQRWRTFCHTRLTDPLAGAPNTFKDFTKALIAASLTASPAQLKVLGQWQDYAEQLSLRLEM